MKQRLVSRIPDTHKLHGPLFLHRAIFVGRKGRTSKLSIVQTNYVTMSEDLQALYDMHRKAVKDGVLEAAYRIMIWAIAFGLVIGIAFLAYNFYCANKHDRAVERCINQ